MKYTGLLKFFLFLFPYAVVVGQITKSLPPAIRDPLCFGAGVVGAGFYLATRRSTKRS